MRYRFEDYEIEIEDPQILIKNVHDYWDIECCDVDVVLKTSTATLPISLGGFSYSQSYKRSDVIDWVHIELKKYIVSDSQTKYMPTEYPVSTPTWFTNLLKRFH